MQINYSDNIYFRQKLVLLHNKISSTYGSKCQGDWFNKYLQGYLKEYIGTVYYYLFIIICLNIKNNKIWRRG